VNMKFVLAFLFAAALCLSAPRTNAQATEQASAQAPTPNQQQELDKDVQLLRQDVRAKKKKLIAANLQLTADQATRFWPVYDQYTADLVQINNAKYDLIKEYAQNWGTITDDQALSMLKRLFEVDAQVNQLRQKYVPIFNKVVPGKTTATFFQLDRRIQSMIDLQLGSQLPLVQDQE
jgi:outer membrane murein-binding lipoprotein Lpp